MSAAQGFQQPVDLRTDAPERAGLAAVMGGTMRSPLTGAVFMRELPRDLNAFPALFAGCVAALPVTALLLRRSTLTEKLARRGQPIARQYSVDSLELVRVGDVMDRQPRPFRRR